MAIYLTDLESLLKLEESEFRARFRERCHHTLEIQLYRAIYRGEKLSSSQCDTAKVYLEAWKARGLSEELPEYRFVAELLELADQVIAGKQVSLEKYAPHTLEREQLEGFDHIIYERRSVREWKNDRVPDELIDKILDAGLWAAHSCNLQSIRYLVIREENAPGLFKGSDIPGGPVHIVLAQDTRVYLANDMPEFNRLLDVGAAAQNIVLAAHAYGLGGCWLTFTSDQMKKRIAQAVNLPEGMRIVTYIDVGYPDQTPCPVYRSRVEDTVICRI